MLIASKNKKIASKIASKIKKHYFCSGFLKISLWQLSDLNAITRLQGMAST